MKTIFSLKKISALLLAILFIFSSIITGCGKAEDSEITDYLWVFENAGKYCEISKLIDRLGEPSKVEEDNSSSLPSKLYYWDDKEFIEGFLGTIIVKTNKDDEAYLFTWEPNPNSSFIKETEKAIKALEDRYKDSWDKEPADDNGNSDYRFYYNKHQLKFLWTQGGEPVIFYNSANLPM